MPFPFNTSSAMVQASISATQVADPKRTPMPCSGWGRPNKRSKLSSPSVSDAGHHQSQTSDEQYQDTLEMGSAVPGCDVLNPIIIISDESDDEDYHADINTSKEHCEDAQVKKEDNDVHQDVNFPDDTSEAWTDDELFFTPTSRSPLQNDALTDNDSFCPPKKPVLQKPLLVLNDTTHDQNNESGPQTEPAKVPRVISSSCTFSIRQSHEAFARLQRRRQQGILTSARFIPAEDDDVFTRKWPIEDMRESRVKLVRYAIRINDHLEHGEPQHPVCQFVIFPKNWIEEQWHAYAWSDGTFRKTKDLEIVGTWSRTGAIYDTRGILL